MNLYESIREEAKDTRDRIKEIAEEVSKVDDELRIIVGKIDSRNCETAEEFDDFLAEIREYIVGVQGRLY